MNKSYLVCGFAQTSTMLGMRQRAPPTGTTRQKVVLACHGRRITIPRNVDVCSGSIASVSPDHGDFRSTPAGSTGRRNTSVKSLCWGFKLQGLTWSFVELASHFVQIGLRMHRQVGALWKVLSQQAIGVLVRPALPRALRIAKIYVDLGRQRKAAMIRKFLSPVPGQGLIQLLW